MRAQYGWGVIVALCLASAGCRRPASSGDGTGSRAPAGRSTPALEEPARPRPAAFAGRFYPGDPAALRQSVRGHLEAAPRVATAPVKMVLVPHAGYEYSGAVAAAAFRQLDGGFERAVIVAANHVGGINLEGAAVERATHYQVPGFEVRVSPQARALLGRRPFVDVPEAHRSHVVEVELPFLREANGERPFEILPLSVGRLDPARAAELVAALASLAQPGTLFVFSVDLSHYHPYDVAVAKDRPCLDAIARMDAGGVASCDTDGTHVLQVMVELAARLALTPRLIRYANSGDVSGDRSRVVGYGAMVFEDRFELQASEQEALLVLARRSVEATVREGRAAAVPAEVAVRFPRLKVARGAFVTLRKGGQLRGCIGSLSAVRPLAEDVIMNASAAAVRDPRFPPVRPDELPSIELSVSVLEAPRPVSPLPEGPLLEWLDAKRPGLILSFEGRRSTFLPEVWEELPEPRAFLGHLCRKQGSPEDCWRQPTARFESYGSQHFPQAREAAR